VELTDIKKFIQKWNEDNTEIFYKVARKIWENPELAMQEFSSMEMLTELLNNSGFSIKKGVAGMPTAFIASYGSGSPVIGINVEYDALPGLSQKFGVSKKEAIIENGPGHGCGHNILGTGAVKAGIAIKTAIDQFGLRGTVKMIGAPGEELCIGKAYLGKAGYLEGFDAFLDWHPWSYNRADYDNCNAYFNVKYHFKGKSCHGNSPWNGRSALDAAILQAHAVEILREHIYPGNPPDGANTINYTFSHTGPEFPSVVPDKTTAWYVGRISTTGEAEDVVSRITNCAKGAALATDTEVEVELITATHHKIPNKTLSEVVHKNFMEIGAPVFTKKEQEFVKEIQRQIGVVDTGLASEIRPFGGGYSVVCDTPEYSWNAPYATAWIAMGPENAGWHHWGVVACTAGSIGQKSMDIAAKVISSSAIELLLNQGLVRKAKIELDERLNGRKYKCLIPERYEPPININADIMKKYRKLQKTYEEV